MVIYRSSPVKVGTWKQPRLNGHQRGDRGDGALKVETTASCWSRPAAHA